MTKKAAPKAPPPQPVPPAGYERLVPFDRKAHGGMGLKVKERYGFARTMHLVPVFLVEFLHVHRHYPIVFADGPEGRKSPVALLSLEEGSNLFVQPDGSWRPETYIPAWLRRWPFFTVDTPKSGMLICVDDSHLGPSDTPWFSSEGEATPTWAPVDRLMTEIEQARAQTEEFSAMLVEKGLLEPFEAHAMPEGGRVRRVRGMMRVDEQKLNALPGDLLESMMQKGQLSRLYAHLFSLANFRGLMTSD